MPQRGVIDLGDDLGEPVGVAGKPSVIFDDHIESLLGSEGGETREAVGGEFDLLVPIAGAAGVHANGMAAQELRRVQPLAMVFHGLLRACLSRGRRGFPRCRT